MHIVLDINVVEPEAYTLQLRAFPPLATGDDPVIDQFDFFGGKPGADSFGNVLVVPLSVETSVYSIIADTRTEGFVVVVYLGIVLCFVILQNNCPVV